MVLDSLGTERSTEAHGPRVGADVLATETLHPKSPGPRAESTGSYKRLSAMSIVSCGASVGAVGACSLGGWALSGMATLFGRVEMLGGLPSASGAAALGCANGAKNIWLGSLWRQGHGGGGLHLQVLDFTALVLFSGAL